MTTHDHDGWPGKLSEHVDGGLTPEESRALEAHLSTCAECRQALADLRDIVARARALGPVEPSRDLWPGIEEAIGGSVRAAGEGDVLAFPGTRRRPAPRGLFLTVPQLAAAAAALVLLSTAATWWAGPGVGTRQAAVPTTPDRGAAASLAARAIEPPPGLAQELAALEGALAQARSRLAPNTVRVLEKNLSVIDRAIDESVRALEVDPSNPFLRDHLDRAYREKADFLREVAAITEWEG